MPLASGLVIELGCSMTSPTLHAQVAQVQQFPIVTLSTDLGVPVFAALPTVQVWRESGERYVTIIVRIPDEVEEPRDDERCSGWMRTSDAATELKSVIEYLETSAARQRVVRACLSGDIESVGEARKRRINPDSFGRWLIREHKKSLDESDRE